MSICLNHDRYNFIKSYDIHSHFIRTVLPNSIIYLLSQRFQFLLPDDKIDSVKACCKITDWGAIPYAINHLTTKFFKLFFQGGLKIVSKNVSSPYWNDNSCTFIQHLFC